MTAIQELHEVIFYHRKQAKLNRNELAALFLGVVIQYPTNIHTTLPQSLQIITAL